MEKHEAEKLSSPGILKKDNSRRALHCFDNIRKNNQMIGRLWD